MPCFPTHRFHQLTMPTIPQPAPGKKTTLDHVAQRAGVSRITVSRVVNDKGGSRATRDRVLQAAAELGYRPNANARDLRYRNVVRLGLLFLRAGSLEASQLLTGLLAQPADGNLQLAVAPCRSLREACEEAGRLVLNGIDGFVLAAPLNEHAELVRQIERAGCAIVALSGAGIDTGRSVVGINESDAAFAMTAHLIGLGHRRIGFIAGDPAHGASLQRLAGYHSALAAHGIACDEALVADSTSTYRSGLDAAEWLIHRAARPTAIFAGNDETAAAAMAVAYRAGIEIPGDLTVAGFGDTPLATAIWPALTSVRVPVERMVGQAIQILARQVRSIRAHAVPEQEQAILEFEVIRRQSDAVPRARPPAPVPGRLEQATGERAFNQVIATTTSATG